MKPRFRQSMNWLHTWVGFSFGWLVYFIFITGTTGYFDSEIDRWMQPEITVVNQVINQDDVIAAAELQLKKLAPGSTQWYIGLPTLRTPFVQIQWLQSANVEKNILRSWNKRYLDTQTGEANDARKTAGGETLYRMHYNLHYIPQLAGYILTSLATMLMLIGLVTGVIIHKKIFIEFFTFRAKKGIWSWLDIHNIFSVLPLPFHLMITYSGLLLLMGITMSSVIDFRYGEGQQNHRKFYNAAKLDIKEQQYEGATWKHICQNIVADLPKKVYISFDIDGLDPKLCPNTGTPVPGGFEVEQIFYLFKQVVESGRTLIGFDLNEVSAGEYGLESIDSIVGARVLYKMCNYMVAK